MKSFLTLLLVFSMSFAVQAITADVSTDIGIEQMECDIGEAEMLTIEMAPVHQSYDAESAQEWLYKGAMVKADFPEQLSEVWESRLNYDINAPPNSESQTIATNFYGTWSRTIGHWCS